MYKIQSDLCKIYKISSYVAVFPIIIFKGFNKIDAYELIGSSPDFDVLKKYAESNAGSYYDLDQIRYLTIEEYDRLLTWRR